MKHRLTAKQKRYMDRKRRMDFIISLAACIVLSPILLILCAAIKLDSRGPVLFQQKRVGIHKKHFKIYKLRTSADALLPNRNRHAPLLFAFPCGL